MASNIADVLILVPVSIPTPCFLWYHYCNYVSSLADSKMSFTAYLKQQGGICLGKISASVMNKSSACSLVQPTLKYTSLMPEYTSLG